MKLSQMFDQYGDIGERDLFGLKVYKHQLPIGFTYNENELSFNSLEYEFVAEIDATLQYRFWDRAGFTFYPYNHEENWRKYLCYPQVPLVWVTLGIWNSIPSHYVCNPNEKLSDDYNLYPFRSRYKTLMSLIKKLAVAGHATHIVFANWNQKTYEFAKVYLLRKVKN